MNATKVSTLVKNNRVEDYIESLIGSDPESPNERLKLLRDGVELLNEAYANINKIDTPKPGSFTPKSGIMILPTNAKNGIQSGIDSVESVVQSGAITSQKFTSCAKNIVKMLLTMQYFANRFDASS